MGREEEEAEAEVETGKKEVELEVEVEAGLGAEVEGRLIGEPGGEGVGESSMTIGSAAVAGGSGREGEASRLGRLG